VNGFALPRQRIANGARRLGLELDSVALDLFETYATFLAEGRTRLNLTTIIDPVEVADKLFLDSLTAVFGMATVPLPWTRLVDVGTGAGFPGVPLAVVFPHVAVTLLDATTRKVEWVDDAVNRAGIRNAWAFVGRAEELGHHPGWRGQFDMATARAVAPLAVIVELLIPLLRPGGVAIALKSNSTVDREVSEAQVALEEVGGVLSRVIRVPEDLLPNRAIVTIVRASDVPPTYPRRPGVPTRHPLGSGPSVAGRRRRTLRRPASP
jgi:16S rRNA (guanine527-N7)-methyltransferase